MSFRTAEPNLKDVLADIHNGIIQLPDFQREWVWDDRHILELIASVSLSFPIGAVMFLEAGGVPFQTRLFEGVELSPAPDPKKLVLDGQQRLTSMYLALYSGKPVKTKTDKDDVVHRVYFLDMKKCLDPRADREEAILSLPDTFKILSDFGRKIDLDLSTLEQQYEKKMFPASIIFDPVKSKEWRKGYRRYHGEQEDSFLMDFEDDVLSSFQQFKVPAIELGIDTTREAVCKVFEKVNTGGVTLTVFELVTATFAASHFNLPEDWKARSERMRERHSLLKVADGTAFLTALTLYASFGKPSPSPPQLPANVRMSSSWSSPITRDLRTRWSMALKKPPNFLPKKKSLIPASFPTRLSSSPCPAFARRSRTRSITPPSRKKSSAGTGAGFSGNCTAVPMKRGSVKTFPMS